MIDERHTKSRTDFSSAFYFIDNVDVLSVSRTSR